MNRSWDGYCVPTVTATGFLPNTEYYIQPSFWDDWSPGNAYYGTTDASGGLVFNSISFNPYPYATYQVKIGDVLSSYAYYDC